MFRHSKVVKTYFHSLLSSLSQIERYLSTMFQLSAMKLSSLIPALRYISLNELTYSFLIRNCRLYIYLYSLCSVHLILVFDSQTPCTPFTPIANDSFDCTFPDKLITTKKPNDLLIMYQYSQSRTNSHLFDAVDCI